MIQKRSVRTLVVAAAVAAASLVAVAGPASAYGGAFDNITCTSSTGYSINIVSTAKGEVEHEVGWFEQEFLPSTGFVYRHSNTHIGGTHDAWVWAWNAPGAFCSTI